MTTGPTPPKRPHPARRARSMAGSLSVAGLFALTGCMAATTKTRPPRHSTASGATTTSTTAAATTEPTTTPRRRAARRPWPRSRPPRRPNPTPRPMPAERTVPRDGERRPRDHRRRAGVARASKPNIASPTSNAAGAGSTTAARSARCTRHAGSPVVVSPETRELVERAVAAWRMTGGLFDPTVLGALVRAGYDRSFDELGPTPDAQSSRLNTDAGAIEIIANTVRLPRRHRLRPGRHRQGPRGRHRHRRAARGRR